MCDCGSGFVYRKLSSAEGLYCSVLCANRYKIRGSYSRRREICKKCKNCHRQFKTKVESQVFCSKNCYYNSLRGKSCVGRSQ